MGPFVRRLEFGQASAETLESRGHFFDIECFGYRMQSTTAELGDLFL